MNDHAISSEETTVGGLSVLAGEVTLRGRPGDCQDTKAEMELRLSPSRPVVIGRAEGGMVPYLDPAYVPTTVLPGTGRTILRRQESDLWVTSC